jgi:glutamate carboxypeptidase
MLRIIIICFLLVQFLENPAQKLSRKEKEIISIVQKNNDAAIQLLEQAVNLNSGTMNLDGVKEVGMLFKGQFDQIGMDTKWIDLSNLNRAGHLFAETKGSKGKRILLIGHLDTVFPENSPFQKMERLPDGTVKGPGTNDMKGGDVIILFALRALHEAGHLADAQIIVALTGDEELTGKPISLSRKDLIDAGKRSDIALGFENSTGFNNVTLARRGSSGGKVEIEGKRAHSSGIFMTGVGAGAVFEAGRILNDFYETLKGETYLTFNPGIILGGTEMSYDEPSNTGNAFGKTNVVAQSVIIDGDLRFISEEQKERTRAKMREIVANNLPETSAKITFFDSYPAMPPTQNNKNLLKTFSQVSTDMGHGPVEAWDPSKRGAADVSFVAQYVACIDGLGAMGAGGHTPNETIDLATFEVLTQRAAVLIYRLINE